MFIAPYINQRHSIWLLIALLLMSLLISTGHQHEADERHPLSQCALCLQLQSGQLAPSNAMPLVASSAQLLVQSHARAVAWSSPAPVYESRAPPRF